ncbi:DNA topoisomerase IV alpha subunit [Cubamyces menziesii]|nr:DNA topoisomerase IV alpha subunit [Cubamyces menziesii]
MPKSSRTNNIVLHLADRREERVEQLPMRSMEMPRRSRGPSSRPFAQLFKTLDLIHEALIDDIPMTKRDMYYNDVDLYGSQSTVDRLVDDLAATWQISRADLSIRASPKGLICGSGLAIHLRSGGVVELSSGEPALIPASEDIERFEADNTLAWVLIVEKEAVFQTLCSLELGTHDALPGRGLVITGKGYPDVATRQLVRTLAENLPLQVPILALVDGDAFGIDILSVYKYGSMCMQHEKEQLAAERVQWLGLWSSELSALGILKDALIPITKHDARKAHALLRRANCPAHWRKELQHMLFTRRKAEIEIISTARTMDCAADLGQRSKYTREGEPIDSGMPLLRYLVAKISAACVEARRRGS